jgi:hypothetical protein
MPSLASGAYFVISVATGLSMQTPQEGWTPAGWKWSAIQSKQPATHNHTLNGAAPGTGGRYERRRF